MRKSVIKLNRVWDGAGIAGSPGRMKDGWGVRRGGGVLGGGVCEEEEGITDNKWEESKRVKGIDVQTVG